MSGTESDPIREAIGEHGTIVAVGCEDTVLQAAMAMHENGVGATVVTDEDSRVIGILTERDLLALLASEAMDPRATPVKSIMVPGPASCTMGTPMHEARDLMMSRRIRHLPIVADDGTAVGMLSSRDVLAHQVVNDRAMRSAAEQVAMLTTCLKSLNFDEVVDLVTRQVPAIFRADRSVLFFPPEDEGEEFLLVSRNNCPCPDGRLPSHEGLGPASRDGGIRLGGAPCACTALGGSRQCMVVPLEVAGLGGDRSRAEQASRGYLCMCLNPDSAGSPEPLLYKGTLIREILNATLTNARLYQIARQESLTDPLTGAGSRRMFEEQLEVEFSRSKRYSRPFCVAIFDVDRFKSINDRLGHIKGDEILRKFADCIRREKRTSDVLARYGGDEFVLLLPETSEAGALILLQRVRHSAEAIPMAEALSFSTSCGVVELAPESRMPANEVIRCADMALYEAKRAGRNRVETWSQASDRIKSKQQVDDEKIEELQGRIAHLSLQSKEMLVQSIWGLIQALEARDKYARSHSENVMRYSVGVAETLDLDPVAVDVVRRAAMIHDIGKIGVPDSILCKSGRLTDEERAVIHQHPLIAVRILDQMQFLQRELPIVRHHHEWWNGQGYPDGISGQVIPRGARILAVADAFDAITSDRVYHRSRPVSRAVEVLVEGSGSQFDPEAVEAMKRWMQRVSESLGADELPTVSDLLGFQEECIVAA
jgi:diguanylate cyclase (GGDEF)-like protein/putative nucleotidyltransferase with HDIG domain